MSDFVTTTLIPNLLFFLLVFIAFSILEALIVLVLLWLERVNHDRIMLLMLRVYKHYRLIHRVFKVLAAILLFGAAWYIWYLFRSLESRPAITLFAVVMLLVITTLYWLITHFKGRLSIKKRGDRVLYLALSMILYFFILTFIDQKFPDYRRYVVDIVVIPAVELFQGDKDTSQEEKLLTEFRQMLLDGKCHYRDFRAGASTRFVHNFVYVRQDPELQRVKGEPEKGDLNAIAVGSICTNGEETFILTKYGKWYWIIESEPI